MVEALIGAVLYCVVVLVIAWILAVLVGMIPLPAPARGVLPTIIWVVAALICLVILVRLLLGIAGPLP
jgi:hypothetical protein